MLLKSPAVLKRLAELHTAGFDKIGTLTLTPPQLAVLLGSTQDALHRVEFLGGDAWEGECSPMVKIERIDALPGIVVL